VRDLTVDLISARKTTVQVVSDVSFQVDPGTIVGLSANPAAESPPWRWLLPNLLPSPRYRVRGSVQLGGFELLSASERQLERIRGAEISLVFQDPLLLEPRPARARQVAEVMRAHGRQMTWNGYSAWWVSRPRGACTTPIRTS